METVTRKLPELENVDIQLEYSLFNMAAAFFGVGSLALTPVFLYILHFTMILQGLGIRVLITAGIMCVMLVLVAGAVLFRFFFRAYHWQTDENGLTIRSLLRTKHINWRDVQDAKVEGSSLGSMRLILQIGRRTRVVVDDTWCWVFPVILASVRQHLAYFGIYSNIGSQSDDTLWYEIPDQLPYTLSWCSRKGWGDTVGSGVVAVMFWLVFIWMLLNESLLASLILFPVLAMTTAALGHTLMSLSTAKRFAVDKHGFEAVTPRGRIQAAWADVTGAYWDNTLNEPRIRVHTRDQQVFLPWIAKDQDSGRLILATIRGLREQAYQALLIPVDLCSYDGVSTDELPELQEESRPRQSETRFIFGALGAVIILFLLGSQLSPQPKKVGDVIVSMVLFAIIIAGRLVVKSYSFTINENGITTRFLGTRKQVRWEEVASVEMSQSSNNYTVRTLKDSTGKVLISFSIPSGAGVNSRARRFLHAKLAGVLSYIDQPKPWQARPRKVDG